MATRRLALIGAKVGPWVSIKTLPIPVLRVRGLGEGVIDGRVKFASGEDALFGVSQNADYNLVDGSLIPCPSNPIEWIQLNCTDVRVICEVISERVA